MPNVLTQIVISIIEIITAIFTFIGDLSSTSFVDFTDWLIEVIIFLYKKVSEFLYLLRAMPAVSTPIVEDWLLQIAELIIKSQILFLRITTELMNLIINFILTILDLLDRMRTSSTEVINGHLITLITILIEVPGAIFSTIL